MIKQCPETIVFCQRQGNCLDPPFSFDNVLQQNPFEPLWMSNMVILVSLVLVSLSEMQPVEWKALCSHLGTPAHIVIFIIAFFL